MKSSIKKTAKIALFVSAVLCLALILVQFLPYWTAPDDPNYKPPTKATAAATTAATTEATTEATTNATTDATTDAATDATTDATVDGTTAATTPSTEDAAKDPTESTGRKVGLIKVDTEELESIEPETDPISIFEFLILPKDHPYIEKYLGANGEKGLEQAAVINSLAGTFCIVLLLGAVSIAFVILKSQKLWISVFPTFVGIGSLIGYLTEPVWKMGNPSLHLTLIILSAALTVASLTALGIWFYSFKFWFMDPKKLENK